MTCLLLWNIFVTNDHGYVPFVIITTRSFPHLWLITGFVTRVTWWVPLVEQDLPTLMKHLIFRQEINKKSKKINIVLQQLTHINKLALIYQLKWGRCVRDSRPHRWSYGSWIYNYLCNQCLSPLMLWIRISIRARCLTLCDKVCQWLATGRCFSPGTPVFSNNKTDRHWNIAESAVKHHKPNRKNSL